LNGKHYRGKILIYETARIHQGGRVFEPQKFIEEKVEWLKKTVGNKKTVVALSGGVDSSVAAILGHRAIPDNLTAVFLDDGLMRKNEPRKVV